MTHYALIKERNFWIEAIPDEGAWSLHKQSLRHLFIWTITGHDSSMRKTSVKQPSTCKTGFVVEFLKSGIKCKCQNDLVIHAGNALKVVNNVDSYFVHSSRTWFLSGIQFFVKIANCRRVDGGRWFFFPWHNDANIEKNFITSQMKGVIAQLQIARVRTRQLI